MLDVVHAKPEVDLFKLFVLEAATPSFTGLVDNPVELVTLMKLADFHIVRKALTASHEVSIIFVLTFLTIAVIL